MSISTAAPLVVLTVFAFIVIVTPLLIVWSWFRFVLHCRLREKISWFSLVALVLTTGSVLLALGSLVYSGATGGFAYYDPKLLRIFRIGLLLSSFALISGLIGAAFRGPIRWQTPAASFGMLLFWFMAAIAE